MRPLKYAAAALMLAALTACTGTGVNTANVFQPQSGKVQLAVQTSDPTIQSVEFQLNGEVIGKDEDGSDGWSLEYDTTQKDDGIYTVTAYGTTSSGTQLQLLDNSLLIQNGGTGGGSSGTGTGTGTGTDTGTTGTQFRPVAASRGWPTSR